MEPIRQSFSSTPQEPLSSQVEAEDAELVCRAPSDAASRPAEANASADRANSRPPEEDSSVVRCLVDAFSRRTSLTGLTSAQSSAGSGPANTNAGRTSERSTPEAYAEAGRTWNGDLFAGVAALKTHDPRSGVDVEVFTASVQVGEQNEIQAGLARIGYASPREGLSFSAAAEALTVRANAGIHNDDGTQGANLGAAATGAAIEATVAYSGWSVTAGAAVSIGASVSSGEARDSDGDGKPERCFKGSIGFTTLGVCTEL